MFEINPVHIAYAVMIVGIICAFFFSKRHRGDLRETASEFVMPFVKLSNYISPEEPRNHLLVKEQEDGSFRVLPAEQQSGEIRAIMKRANEDFSVKTFAELTKAADKLEREAGFNRTHKEQFVQPVREMLYLAHTFLCGCENPDTLDTQEKIREFESYLHEQPQHRYMLMKRLPGMKNEEYRKLNTVYVDEMEALEKAEFEARKKK